MTPDQEQLLGEWYAAKALAEQAAKEIATFSEQFKSLFELSATLKERVAASFFPGMPEGTTKYPLPNGFALKCVQKYSHKLDAEALETVREPLAKKGVSLDSLIRRKPELELRAYRALTKEQRDVLDTILTTTPGKPELEIVPPKAVGK